MTRDSKQASYAPAFLTDEPVVRSTLTIALAHGAGAPMDTPFMTSIARGLAAGGVCVARFEFPYMHARRTTGRRSPPDRPAVLLDAWRAAITALGGAERLVIGGKSLGGRMASIAVAEGLAAAGIVFLGYPFHPPGKPDRVRDEHLSGINRPMLFLQGSKDPFGTPAVRDAVIAKLPTATLHLAEGGGHSLERSRRDDAREVAASFAPLVASFMRGKPV